MDAEEFIAKGGADPRGGAIAPPRGGGVALPGVPPGGASDRTRNINHRS